MKTIETISALNDMAMVQYEVIAGAMLYKMQK